VTVEDANATPFVTRVIHHEPQLSFILLWVLGNVRAIIVRLLGSRLGSRTMGGLRYSTMGTSALGYVNFCACFYEML
jgi:hypothetical protein